MNTVITIKCKPEELQRKLSELKMSKEIETTPGWYTTIFPDFSIKSVCDSPDKEIKIHYIDVSYKRKGNGTDIEA